MKKLFTSLFLVVGLNACSNVDYMDRADLVQALASNDIDEVKYSDYNQSRTIRTLGTVNINNFDEVSGENDPTVVNLKKNKSRLYAETQLFESDNKEKTFFDETIFNVGVDKKTKAMNMELTLKF